MVATVTTSLAPNVTSRIGTGDIVVGDSVVVVGLGADIVVGDAAAGHCFVTIAAKFGTRHACHCGSHTYASSVRQSRSVVQRFAHSSPSRVSTHAPSHVAWLPLQTDAQ
jgi:hypothetical protein